MTIITLGGKSGNGGRNIGPKVSHELHIDYVDRLILSQVARQTGSTLGAIQKREDEPATFKEKISKIINRILQNSASNGIGADPYFVPNIASFLSEEYNELPNSLITQRHELDDQIFIDTLTQVINEIADSGNSVIVGRGAHIILKDYEDVLRIGLVSEIEDRIKIISERENCDSTEAESRLNNRDKARQIYFERYFNLSDPDDIRHYDFMINTSKITEEYATEMIVNAATSIGSRKFYRLSKTA